MCPFARVASENCGSWFPPVVISNEQMRKIPLMKSYILRLLLIFFLSSLREKKSVCGTFNI